MRKHYAVNFCQVTQKTTCFTERRDSWAKTDWCSWFVSQSTPFRNSDGTKALRIWSRGFPAFPRKQSKRVSPHMLNTSFTYSQLPSNIHTAERFNLAKSTQPDVFFSYHPLYMYFVCRRWRFYSNLYCLSCRLHCFRPPGKWKRRFESCSGKGCLRFVRVLLSTCSSTPFQVSYCMLECTQNIFTRDAAIWLWQQ